MGGGDFGHYESGHRGELSMNTASSAAGGGYLSPDSVDGLDHGPQGYGADSGYGSGIGRSTTTATSMRTKSIAAKLIRKTVEKGAFAKRLVVDRKQLKIGRKIAAGGCGQINKALYSGVPVAAKRIFSEMLDPLAVDEFLQEAEVLSRLNHPHIVHLFGIAGKLVFVWFLSWLSFFDVYVLSSSSSATEDNGGMIIVTELCDCNLLQKIDGLKDPKESRDSSPHAQQQRQQQQEGGRELDEEDAGSLAIAVSMDTTRGPGGGLSPPAFLQVARDLALTVQFIHGQGVVHRDLKPANILFDRQGKLKLCDFGLARVSRGGLAQTNLTLGAGTPIYMPPECMVDGPACDEGAQGDEGGGSSQAVKVRLANAASLDVYSLSMVLLAMWTGEEPWKNTPVFKFLATIVGDPSSRPPVGEHCPDALRSLLCDMWHVEPSRRLSMDAVVYRVGQLTEAAPDVFGSPAGQDGDSDGTASAYHTLR
jgi:serine/threonine protein kinase